MDRILIVEDSSTQRQHLAFVLESAKFTVDQACNGLEALEAARRNPPDLVISDVIMPGLTGYELCRKLKGDPQTARLPVILVTSLNNPMDVVEGLACGADGFLLKPFSPEALVDRATAILEKRKQGVVEGATTSMEVLGKKFEISAEKQQILTLLFSTVEERERANLLLSQKQKELDEANGKLGAYARQLEGKVRASEEKYKFLMESFHDGVFVIDTLGKILNVNRQGEAMLACPRQDIEGKVWLDFIVMDDRETVLAHHAMIFRGESPPNLSARIQGRDGQIRDLEFSNAAVSLEGETFLLSIGRDISERKRAEELARRQEEQLRQSQKLEAIGRLAAGVAHDFNNLLNVVGGNGDLLLAAMPLGDPLREEVQEIKKSVRRGSELTHQLLVFGHKEIVQPTLLDLNAVTAGVSRMLSRILGEDVELIQSLDPELKSIMGDAVGIEQILMNLAINARDAMPGGGKILIETRNMNLDGPLDRNQVTVPPGRWVLLSVSDTGTGIDSDTQEHIFEPFFTTKEPGKGTGLGLATVYGVVQKVGGYVWVHSALGKGATFNVCIPAAEGQGIAEADVERSRPAGGSETVLVVEDEEPLRRMITRSLQQKGYEVLQGINGLDGLETALRHGKDIHLLLTDCVMPKMDGRQMAGKIKEMLPAIKVLFMSGYPKEMLSRQGIVDPDIQLIRKPFSTEDLLTKLREVLDETSHPPSERVQP